MTDRELEKTFCERALAMTGNDSSTYKSYMNVLTVGAKPLLWLEYMGLMETSHFICSWGEI